VIALGLDLVLRWCILLTAWCLRELFELYSEGIAAYKIKPTVFVMLLPPYTRENEAYDVLTGNSIVKTIMSSLNETILKIYLCGEPRHLA
jgi:hypothetical protein